MKRLLIKFHDNDYVHTWRIVGDILLAGYAETCALPVSKSELVTVINRFAETAYWAFQHPVHYQMHKKPVLEVCDYKYLWIKESDILLDEMADSFLLDYPNNKLGLSVLLYVDFESVTTQVWVS